MVSIWIKAWCLLAAVILVQSSMIAPAAAAGDNVDFGPIYSRYKSIHGDIRVRALGPFIERQEREGFSFGAIRPLHAGFSDEASAKVLDEYLWPAVTLKTFGNQKYWRVVTWFGHDYDINQPSRYKNHFFPFLFQGRAADNSRYFAVFPVGGSVKEILGRDRFSFALFPLYARSQVNEAVTYDVLWPFVSWGKHDNASQWRVFPFYGQAECEGAWRKRFVMWPIWTSVDFEKADGGGFVLFPITGYSRVDETRTYWMVPPLFKWMEAPGRRAVNCPWPFFQYETGEEERLYLWPLWGHREKDGYSRSFFLWPVFHSGSKAGEHQMEKSLYALPFLYSDKTFEMDADGSAKELKSRYFKIWPLFSFRREGDASRFRSLDLWPMKHTAPIERNFAPLWTLYNRERKGDAFDSELLWGVYRNRRGNEGERFLSVFPLFSVSRGPESQAGSSWNVLAGLLGREIDCGVSRWRVLYFLKFGGRKDLEND